MSRTKKGKPPAGSYGLSHTKEDSRGAMRRAERKLRQSVDLENTALPTKVQEVSNVWDHD